MNEVFFEKNKLAVIGGATLLVIIVGSIFSGGSVQGSTKNIDGDYQSTKVEDMKKPGMKNKKRSKEMVTQMNDFGRDETFHKAVIISDDWHYAKDNFGNPEGRYLNTLVTAKRPDGHCTVQEFGFIQYGDNNGNYNKSFKRFTTGGQSDMNCKHLK